jgi:hypothetical protein
MESPHLEEMYYLRKQLLEEIDRLAVGLPNNTASAQGYHWALNDMRRFIDRVVK